MLQRKYHCRYYENLAREIEIFSVGAEIFSGAKQCGLLYPDYKVGIELEYVLLA